MRSSEMYFNKLTVDAVMRTEGDTSGHVKQAMINGVGKGLDGSYVDRKTETRAQTTRTEE